MSHVSNKEVYLAQHPFDRNVFVMMKYGEDPLHSLIEANVRKAFKDVRFYHPILAKDLAPATFPTLAEAVTESIKMCRYGVAIFTSQKGTQFNPNVAFEMGMMLEQKKEILILKDKILGNLFINVSGTVYEKFDSDLDELRVGGNQFYTALRNWLERKKEIQEASIDVVFITGIEDMIDDPYKTAIYFESQLRECVETIARHARLILPSSDNLLNLIKFLYWKRQITYFIYLAMRKGLESCEKLKATKKLSPEEREHFLALTSLIRDIYNDWLRHYSYYLHFIKER